jgi:transposase
VEEVTDEPLYRDRVCGSDIGKAQMAVTIRVPSDQDPARRMAETRSFGTTRREVLALADWLRCRQVPAVVMEATGDYGKGPFYRLEAEGFEMVLADPKQVKNLPGRPKRDPSDSRWLAQCFERGAVRGCFAATPEFRLIREHTRYRRDLTGERTREKQRTGKLPESAGIKISSVITDLHGMTGRDIMDHLIAGERDPKALARPARGKARPKIPRLQEALEGTEFFTAGHAALLRAMLARIDQLAIAIDELTAVIERLLAPCEEQLQQAESMPGWGRRAAQDALAETGADMSKFPTGGAPGLLGRAGSPGPPVRQPRRPGPAQEGQPVPRRDHRRDRRRGRQDPDPRRRPLPAAIPPLRQSQSPGRPRQHPAEGLPQALVHPRHAVRRPRPGLLRHPGQHPPPDRPPRRQARCPRLRSHPRPHPRARTTRTRTRPGPPDPETRHRPCRPNLPGSAAACPESALFSGQP